MGYGDFLDHFEAIFNCVWSKFCGIPPLNREIPQILGLRNPAFRWEVGDFLAFRQLKKVNLSLQKKGLSQ